MSGEEDLELEILLDFVAESTETLDTAEPILIDFDNLEDPREIQSAVDTIFRAFHSMKGAAGYLQQNNIARLTHMAETVLQEVRKRPEIGPQCTDVLIQSCDVLRQMLEQIPSEKHDHGFDEGIDSLIAQMKTLLGEESEAPPPPSQPAEPTPAPPSPEAEIEFTPVAAGQATAEAEIEFTPVPAGQATAEAEIEFTPVPAGQATAEAEIEFTPVPAAAPPPRESAPATSDEDQSIVQAFIETAEEQLENTEDTLNTLVKFRDEVDNEEFLHTIMRNFHTIKGNAGFLGFALIEKLSHRAESLIVEIRGGNMPFDDENVVLVEGVVDLLKSSTNRMKAGEPLEEERFEDLIDKLQRSLDGQLPEPTPSAPALPAEPTPPAPATEKPAPPASTTPAPAPAEKPTPPAPAAEKTAPPPPPKAPPKPAEKKDAKPAAKTQEAQDIRVSLPKLDHLIDLVGELVIAEAMISHHPSLFHAELEDLRNTARQLNRNIRELQELAMSMRMVPVSATFRRMIRVVRDISRKLGKQVELEIQGEHTEVDKTLVEKIADPMLHLIRNSMDHGLEPPEERKAAGKDPTGRVLLNARHVGNEVWISVSDDGRGLHRGKILKKAMERGLISQEQADALPDEEVWKLIMEAGFSTAEKVTDVSGRGVGMDVVKQNIESLRGSVDVAATTGKGSVFTLRIPLTLSIIDGLLVRVGATCYALPTITIQETLRPNSRNITRTMDGSEMLRIREQLLPIVRLHEVYGITPDTEYLTQGMLLVIEQASERFALFVDAVMGQQQIVVKALPESMNEVEHLSGCTILGDGQVGLIVDVGSLAQQVSNNKKNQKKELMAM